MIQLISRKLLLVLLMICTLSACTPSKLVQGPFLKTSALETELKKGVSTKMDVQRVLGSPQGFGSAAFPVTGGQHEIWYYQNIQVDNIVSKESYITLDMHQKVLLVFFSRGLFDGFLWFSGTIKGEGNQ